MSRSTLLPQSDAITPGQMRRSLLPAPIRPDQAAPSSPAGEPSWRTRAACRGTDPSLWVPERKTTAPVDIRALRAICATCPVFDPCDAYAATLPAGVYGVYAGKTQRTRQRERQQQRRRGGVA